MTPELANFAARLRAFISSSTPAAADVRRLRQFPISDFRFPIWGSEPPHVGSYEDFDALALELFRFQFAHNAAYRRICETRRATPEAVTRWMQIPAVPAGAFKEFEMTCLPAAERTTVFHSSGTSGQRPSRHFHNAESLAIYEASLWPWFERHVAQDLRFTIYDLRLAILAPPPVQAPHSSLVHMFEIVRRVSSADNSTFVGRVEGDGSWTVDFGAALRALHVACDSATPLVLLGTAFSFVHWLDELAEQDLRFQLPSGSRVMETGGYKGRSRSLPKAELHALITQRLGVPPSHIVCEYGMSELSSQAYDRTIQPGSQFPPHPGPLPKERENWSQSPSESGAVKSIGSRTLPSPLPPAATARCDLPRRCASTAGGATARRVREHGRAGEGEYAAGMTNPSPVTRHFHFPPWARVQIISPETGLEVGEGETGLIRVFDLANVCSVLAIQTEDLGIRRGDGFELTGRAALAEPRGCSLMAVNL